VSRPVGPDCQPPKRRFILARRQRLAREGVWRFKPRWSGLLDLDGLAAPQSRAIDTALKVVYDLSPRISLAGGCRIFDDGADNDELCTFERFDHAMLSLTWRFG